MDLEKFFDRVNHDILMSRLARHIEDKRILRLIRRYLQAGMMEDGLVTPRVGFGHQRPRSLVECRASHMNQAVPNRFFVRLGLVSLLQESQRLARTL